jgi:molecular chaperone GrpE
MTTESVETPEQILDFETEAQARRQAAEPEAIERRAPTLDELEAELAAARAKADETWDLLLRARAETENLRRRQATELEKAHKYALDSFVRELLQVDDSLELGHAAALEPGADIDRLREGNTLTLKLLRDTMAKFGVAPVEPEGQPFNPELHQAMTMQPRADLPPNTVVAVMQKGYTLNGRLVRPALVMVSRAP